MTDVTQLACTCGKVRLEVARAPIISAECHCNSCREAGARLKKLPSAPQILESNGGTRFVLYRKDRVRFPTGADNLREFRLKPDSPTRRVIATCCNTPMFLEFQNGHWLSVYAHLWPSDIRPLAELRTMTSDLSDPSVLSGDVPNAKRQSLSFFGRLLGAWIAMGFRVSKITINGEVRV